MKSSMYLVISTNKCFPSGIKELHLRFLVKNKDFQLKQCLTYYQDLNWHNVFFGKSVEIKRYLDFTWCLKIMRKFSNETSNILQNPIYFNSIWNMLSIFYLLVLKEG